MFLGPGMESYLFACSAKMILMTKRLIDFGGVVGKVSVNSMVTLAGSFREHGSLREFYIGTGVRL